MNRRTLLLGTLGAAVGAVLPEEQVKPSIVMYPPGADDGMKRQCDLLLGYSQTSLGYWWPNSDPPEVVFLDEEPRG